jgi:acyl-CoA hydrolase
MNEITTDSLFQVKQFRVVFPKHLNTNGSFFGGEAMQWLDEVAYITATLYTRQRMVTVKISNVLFLKPIRPNCILEITGNILKISNVKVFIKVEVYAEEMYTLQREKSMEADFTFAACKEDLTPIALKISGAM